ncbi:MAG: type IV pilus assembly protein PilM [Kiritimatiellae bacterium]|nr:type IV pilus assembly protein PilM [Kiritimatiellia bacterium]
MSKKFLTLDIGASSITLAEYEASGAQLTLLNYGTAALAAPIDSGDADTILSPAILEIVREKGIKPGKVAVSLSGQMVFPRFAAIPFVGSDEQKFDQMVRYEIEQNIPFPIDEMVCDRQILGETENGDKAVLIVAAKVDQVEAITNALVATGFSPEIVDVASLSVMNAIRAAAPDDGSCVVALDIGAKTTSLVISEGEKLYNRSIPVAGNTITKEIAQALGCTLEEADRIKREEAYVSLGGVTEDEDPMRDKVAKVCRAVMTRLHAELSRSINFYRSQQGGGTPVKLYLTGGTALLPHIGTFFGDSLQIDVELFNPFETIAVAPSIDASALETGAALLAPTAGLALHCAGAARYGINLLPQSILDARAEVKRIPFVAAAGVMFVAAAVCALLAVGHGKDVVESRLDAAEAKARELQDWKSRVDKAQKSAKEAEADAEALRALVMKRAAAGFRLNAVRMAIGEDLWIERWQGDSVTFRGWKDRVAAFAERAGKGQTAPEIVVSRLKSNPAVDPDSVKVVDMTAFGKDGCLEQFTVELKFK